MTLTLWPPAQEQTTVDGNSVSLRQCRHRPYRQTSSHRPQRLARGRAYTPASPRRTACCEQLCVQHKMNSNRHLSHTNKRVQTSIQLCNICAGIYLGVRRRLQKVRRVMHYGPCARLSYSGCNQWQCCGVADKLSPHLLGPQSFFLFLSQHRRCGAYHSLRYILFFRVFVERCSLCSLICCLSRANFRILL